MSSVPRTTGLDAKSLIQCVKNNEHKCIPNFYLQSNCPTLVNWLWWLVFFAINVNNSRKLGKILLPVDIISQHSISFSHEFTIIAILLCFPVCLASIHNNFSGGGQGAVVRRLVAFSVCILLCLCVQRIRCSLPELRKLIFSTCKRENFLRKGTNCNSNKVSGGLCSVVYVRVYSMVPSFAGKTSIRYQ